MRLIPAPPTFKIYCHELLRPALVIVLFAGGELGFSQLRLSGTGS